MRKQLTTFMAAAVLSTSAAGSHAQEPACRAPMSVLKAPIRPLCEAEAGTPPARPLAHQVNWRSAPPAADPTSNVRSVRVPGAAAAPVASPPAASNPPATPNVLDAADKASECPGVCSLPSLAACDAGPSWTARAGIVILDRDEPSPFAAATNAATGATLIDAEDCIFDYATGVDVGLIRHCDCYDLEFRFFGIDDWTSAGPVTLPNFNINAATPILNVPGGDAFFAYDSELYSTEFNLRRPINDRFFLLAGFRYVELNEDIRFGVTQPNPTTEYFINTDNRLYGLQVGGEGVLWSNGARLRLDGFAKVGGYHNDADHFSLINQPAAPPTALAGPVNDSDEHIAFLGEIGIVGVYQLSDRWALRTGYQLLWIEGVALASDQIGATNFNTNSGIDVSGSAFYHGALIGLEWAR